MGNWRTVVITGSCNSDDVPTLRKLVGADCCSEEWGCLSGDGGSLCGLANWGAEAISASGNLAERDFDVEDVAEAARTYAQQCLSLKLKIHCGGDYEDETCIATVTVENGKVSIGEPEVEKVHGVSDAEAKGRLMTMLQR